MYVSQPFELGLGLRDFRGLRGVDVCRHREIGDFGVCGAADNLADRGGIDYVRERRAKACVAEAFRAGVPGQRELIAAERLRGLEAADGVENEPIDLGIGD